MAQVRSVSRGLSWTFLGILLHVVRSLEVPAAEEGRTFQEILGLEPEATGMDAQLKYVNLTNSYQPKQRQGPEARKRFVEVQKAFVQFSTDDIQDETLAMVNYWDHVQLVDSDVALERFAELHPGGSGHLRMIYVVDNAQQKHWQIFSAATQLHGRLKVAQLSPDGKYGALLRSFKIKQHPAAVLYDPISRASRVGYGLEGVRHEVERLMRGQHGPGDYIARVQEFDQEYYDWRCPGKLCDWTLMLATTAETEQREDFANMVRPFVEACKMLHFVREKLSVTSACFWLRADRTHGWKSLLESRGANFASGMVVGALQNTEHAKALVLAPKEMAAGTAVLLHGWLWEKIQEGIVVDQSLLLHSELPAIPAQLEPWEEPEEPAMQAVLKDLKGKILAQLGALDADKLFALWDAVKKWDQEDQTMLAGAVMLAVLALSFLCRLCCCGGGRRPSEEQTLEEVAPVLVVTLPKQEGERLGMNIAPATQAAFNIIGIDEAGLMGRWNAGQPDPEKRAQPGDHIVWVSARDSTGKARIATTCSAMSDALKGTGDISLGIAIKRPSETLQCVRGTVVLKGLTLQECVAEFSAPLRTTAGGPADAAALEVSALGHALEQRNAQQRQLGSCCTQSIEVGDRIVSVNGSIDIRSSLGVKDPTVIVARFRPRGAVRTHVEDITLERSGDQDRLGLHIRNRPAATAEIEVLDVVDGGMVARWNAGGNRPVLAGDRLVAVNGARDRQSMQAALQGSKATLTFERYVDDSSSHGGVAAGASAAPMFGGAQAQFGQPQAGFPVRDGLAPTGATNAAMKPPSAGAAAATPPPQAGDCGGMCCLLFGSAFIGLMLGAAGMVAGAVPAPEKVSHAAIQAAKRSDAVVQPMPESARKFMERIHPELYVDVGVLLMFIGCALTVHFFWYEFSMIWHPLERRFFPQVVSALLASVFLGHGSFFLLVWAGVYA